MLFAQFSKAETVVYGYIYQKIDQLYEHLQNARLQIQKLAGTSSDITLRKSLNLLSVESEQCENELKSVMNSINADSSIRKKSKEAFHFSNESITSMPSLALYCEHVYVEKYMQLLNDRHISDSVKTLMQHHVAMFKSTITQLELLLDCQDFSAAEN